MEKILKVHSVNDYARYIGAEELHPLISVIHYDELEHCRHSLNNYDVYGIFIADVQLDELTYGLVNYDMHRHALMCVTQVLTQSLARMKDYLSKEPDLAPFQKMILSENARWLFGQTTNKPTADVPHADTMLYRLAEIEIHPQYLREYLAAAAEIQKASLAEEPGVICLFPTQTKEDSCQIRILEIYASQQAYQHHIQTAHFLKYKQGTLHMVKHLKLQDLQPLTPETMNSIFKR